MEEIHRKRVEKLWNNIETHLTYPVPVYLKKIFEFSSLDNSYLLKGMSLDELLKLEDMWNSPEYELEAKSKGNIRDYYGTDSIQIRRYSFNLGIKQVIKVIHELIQTKPDSFWDCDHSDAALNTVLSQLDKWSAQYSHVNETKSKTLEKSTLMHMLVKALANNSEAKSKEAYRYDNSLKLISGYIFVLGGRILYQNLSSNLPLPSLTTATRMINATVKPIVQGKCRVDELKNFLNKHNLPKYVWISEDATGMVPKVQYDAKNNQIVGLVQPIDKNTGFPQTDSFKATSFSEMKKCFDSNVVASYLYCYMIQPLQKNAPSFCFNIFGTDSCFNTEDTMKRLDYIKYLLKENGITVLGCSGDGDARIVKMMRIKSRLGQIPGNAMYQIKGFHASHFPPLICMQDQVHLATKLKTRLFKISITLPIGKYIVSSSHLRFLLVNFTKDRHLLTSRHLDGKDKMNFESVIKISSRKVIDLLKSVPGSEATQEYLEST